MRNCFSYFSFQFCFPLLLKSFHFLRWNTNKSIFIHYSLLFLLFFLMFSRQYCLLSFQFLVLAIDQKRKERRKIIKTKIEHTYIIYFHNFLYVCRIRYWFMIHILTCIFKLICISIIIYVCLFLGLFVSWFLRLFVFHYYIVCLNKHLNLIQIFKHCILIFTLWKS